MDSGELALFLLAAFATGSIPFGWIIARLWGIHDLREVGSANVGATNVVRSAGWLPGALTFGLDFAKGVVPVLYFPEAGIWFGLAAVLGHCFSPFLSFRGGKGVSTTLGALVAFNPLIGGASLIVYALVLAVTRVSAIGSLFAMLAALGGTLVFSGSDAGKLATIVMTFIVLARHRSNWDKLLKDAVVLAVLMSAALGTPRARAAELNDFRGKPIVATSSARRIAALMPSIAEIVAGLGASDRLVAVPDYARLPDRLKATHLGGYNSISAEAVYSTHPDLVLASMDGNDSALVAQLERLGLRVVTINTQSLDDIARSIEIIAASIGQSKNPQIAAFHKALAALPRAARHKPPRVFVQVGWEPLVTVGYATFIGELVRRAGGYGIFEDAPTRYPRPNPEEIVARDPDVIIICRLTDTGDEADRASAFWGRFTRLKAVKSGHIFVMPVDWLTKPGFNLMNGMKELERIMGRVS